MNRHRNWENVWWFALSYFVFYALYSAAAKALSEGLWLGTHERLSGFELLPATVIGSLVSAPIFLGVTGLWRQASVRRLAGIRIPTPRRDTLLSATCAAVIVGATTLNFTFEGVSILLALLLMRGGVLILCPLVDRASGRRVEWYSWAALGLSLLAVAVALLRLSDHTLSLIVGLNLGAYLLGYTGRFWIMSRHAKTDDAWSTRRYFVEEHMSTMPILMGLVIAAALVAPGEIGAALRRGFTSFLLTDAALPAFGIGVLYELLFVFGTLIYLDRRAYTYCVPINRGSSLLAGLAASGFLSLVWGYPPPAASSLVALVFVGAALVLLAAGPTREFRRMQARTSHTRAGTLLFVCAGNTKRSPIAAALCRDMIARQLGVPSEHLSALGLRIISAGLSAEPYAPMANGARRALRALGIRETNHCARPLDADLVRTSQAVFCMTEAQRQAVLRLVPEASHKVWRLDPGSDIAEPAGDAVLDYVQYTMQVRTLVGRASAALLGSAQHA